MALYYLHDGAGQSERPYSVDELKEKNISPETHVWTEGCTDWIQAKEVEELKQLFKSMPPPFPTLQPQQLRPTYIAPVKAKNNTTLMWSLIGGGTLLVIIFFVVLITNIGSRMNEVATAQTEVAQQVQQVSEKQSAEEIERQQKKAANDAITARNIKIRNSWFDYFTSKQFGSYHIGGFGGISGYQVQIINNSEFMLDEYIVRVSYFLKNGNLYESHDLKAVNIPAKSYQVLTAPESNRGMSAEYEIISARSSRLNFFYSQNYNSGNPNDPYKYN